MPTCPHCNIEIRINELPYQGWYKNFRICPNCGKSFTVDNDTKYRQAVCIVVALISLTFTLLLYYESEDWLVPALASYIALALILYWGNRKVFFVSYEKDQTTDGDT